MAKTYKVVYQEGVGEISEKKSRFIAHVVPVETQKEAEEFFNRMKKQYWDAKHNCSAFVIGKNNEMQRCSDDGEPAGTAGRPMLEVLLKEEIHNVAVVVTRYFGGVLLGTGGLVRAYQKSVQEGLKNAIIVEKISGQKIQIQTDYTDIGKIQYIINEKNIKELETVYSEKVEMLLVVAEDKVEDLEKEIKEATAARVAVTILESVSFSIVEENVIFWNVSA